MAPDSSSNQFLLNLELVRFEERFAVLRHERIGEIKWPIKNLPDDIKVGDSVSLKVDSPKTEEDAKYENMRRLLEELIN